MRGEFGARPYTEAVWRDERDELQRRYPHVHLRGTIRKWIQASWSEPWRCGERDVIVTAGTPAELLGELERNFAPPDTG